MSSSVMMNMLQEKNGGRTHVFFYYSQIKNIYDKSPFRNKARVNFSCTEMYCIELKTLIQFINSSVSEAHNAKGQPSTAALYCSINRGCVSFS